VAFLEPGDEVILFEPYFDQFLPSITFNHGVPVYVPLHPPTDFRGGSTSDDWTIDFDELRRAITPKTKMILVNTPLNPVGKVFTQEELQKIADLTIEHNIMVLADEVVSHSSYHTLCVTLIYVDSTTVSSLTTSPIFASRVYRACGSVQ
jgi:kynurenine aminotransferase